MMGEFLGSISISETIIHSRHPSQRWGKLIFPGKYSPAEDSVLVECGNKEGQFILKVS